VKREKFELSQSAILKIARDTIHCDRCPRLRKYCQKVAKEKRKSFADEEYWGKPVPSFGDPHARVLIVGLAPAAHGANRTGRMFTGDNSGLWLYRALHQAGLANQAESTQINDGLELKGVMITAIAHCAPPENKPSSSEIQNCSEFLKREIEALENLEVFVVLGQMALKGLWSVLPEEWKPSRTIPKFSHGANLQLNNGKRLICSYHPSQQNTFTKKLTKPMFDAIFELISKT